MTTDKEVIALQLKFMQNKDRVIKGLCKQLADLEAGACRFNCRTAKENWIEGWRCGAPQWKSQKDAEEAYNEYKQKQGKSAIDTRRQGITKTHDHSRTNEVY